MPLIACDQPLPEGTDPVPCGGPVTVTGAQLGLSLQQTDDGPMLLPSWLFTVEKSMHPLVQVAVEPRLLEPSDGAARAAACPAAQGPPYRRRRRRPTPVPTQPASRFTAVTPRRRRPEHRRDVLGRRAGVLRLQGARRSRTTDTVAISVVESRDDGAKVCIELAVEVKKTVPLDAPLDRRRVVDADTGETLLGPAK